MRTSSTSIRLDPRIKKEFEKLAKNMGLTMSALLSLMMNAAVEGKIRLAFIDTTSSVQYPDAYAAELNARSEELLKEYNNGKRKAYDTADDAFAALLKEADEQ